MTRRRNNDIPGQCSESRECMAERQTRHTTRGQEREEIEKQRKEEKETQRGGKERQREKRK